MLLQDDRLSPGEAAKLHSLSSAVPLPSPGGTDSDSDQQTPTAAPGQAIANGRNISPEGGKSASTGDRTQPSESAGSQASDAGGESDADIGSDVSAISGMSEVSTVAPTEVQSDAQDAADLAGELVNSSVPGDQTDNGGCCMICMLTYEFPCLHSSTLQKQSNAILVLRLAHPCFPVLLYFGITMSHAAPGYKPPKEVSCLCCQSRLAFDTTMDHADRAPSASGWDLGFLQVKCLLLNMTSHCQSIYMQHPCSCLLVHHSTHFLQPHPDACLLY